MDQAELMTLVSYDPDIGEFRRLRSCGRWMAGDVAGSERADGYTFVVLNGRRYRAHHLAWLYVHGVMPAVIDHVNRDPSDNRISNLRLATLSENQQNRKQARNNSSGFRGASFNRQKGKWLSQINSKGRHYFLGWYDSAEDAGASYELAKHALHTFHPTI